MDQSVQNQPVVVQASQPSFFSNYWKLLVGIPVILASILALNYFNILTLSLLSPKVFGLLPHKPFNQTFGAYTQQTQTPSTPTIKPYICPVDKKLCKEADTVTVAKAIPPFTGLGYDNLASGSAVIAITAGKYNSGVSVDNNGSKTTVLTILDDAKNVEVDYQFKGKAYIPQGTGRGRVKPGDIIGWTSGQRMDKGLLLKPYYLIVSIQDLKTKDFTKLDPVELIKNTP